MRRETAVILVLVALVVVPLWGLSIAAGNTNQPVAVHEPANSSLNPTGRIVNTPTETSVYSSGILSFLGVFAIIGVVGWQTHVLDRLGRVGSPITDVAEMLPGLPAFVETEYRRVTAYWPAPATNTGLVLVAVLSLVASMFAILFAVEVLGPSRLQFLGLYGGLTSLSLALLVTVYLTYFVPSIEVEEDRTH